MKKQFRSVLVFLLCASLGGAQSESDGAPPHCQIVDGSTDPLYRVSLAIAPKERLENYGRSAFLELDVDWRLAYFHDVLWGNIDVNPRLRTTVITDSAGRRLPNQVMELSLDTGWTARTIGGTAVRIRARPGVYSDVEALDAGWFHAPFSLAVIQSFNDELSGLAGFDVRPGFDRMFIPLAALAWEPNEALRIEAGIPESKAEWFPGRQWSLHAGFAWMNTSYDLSEEAGLDRGRITLEDCRVYTGFGVEVPGNARFVCDVGYLFDRGIRFQREAPGVSRDIDMDNGMFVRMAMIGPF